jgi:hypothetical protein
MTDWSFVFAKDEAMKSIAYIHRHSATRLAVIAATMLLVSCSSQPTATATPSAGARSLPASSELAAGTYTMPARFTPVAFNFTVPAGWSSSEDYFVNKDFDGPGEVGFAAWEITHVFGDGCHTEGTVVEVGSTVDDLATALASGQAGRETSGPTDVTFAGDPAKRVELFLPADWDNADCPLVRNWPETGGSPDGGWRARPGQTDVVYVLDVGGERVVISTWHLPGAPETDLAELEQILASVRFDV